MVLKDRIRRFLHDARIGILTGSEVLGSILKSYFQTFCFVFVHKDPDSFVTDAKKYGFNAAICDRTLSSGVNAEDVLTRLREDKSTKEIPFLVITSSEDLNWGLKEVFPDFVLPKPFSEDLLVETVFQLVRLRQQKLFPKRKVLIADDSPTSREYLKKVLEIEDDEAVEAETGRKALEIMYEMEKDLKFVTMDFYMPDMNGLEVVKKAKEIGVFVPIFMITSETDEAFTKRAFESGVTFYFSKNELSKNREYILRFIRSKANAGSRPILIVEENPVTRHLLLERILLQGYPAIAVDSYETGLRILKLNRILVTLINLDSSEEEKGVEFLKSLKKLDLKDYEKIAMAYSASNEFLTPFKAFSEGASDFLKIPFSLPEFYIRIQNLVRLRKHLKELEASRAQLYRISVEDPLTKLKNRRFLMERLEEHVKEALRHNLDVSVMLIDLNRFKHINDTFGHEMGDKILVHFADLLRRFTRETDIPARYGGDEFVVLLPHTDKKGCEILAKRLKETVKQHQPEEKGVELSISVGCASLSEIKEISESKEISASELLLKLADERMYKDKKAGGRT